jgi:hypothetical protein
MLKREIRIVGFDDAPFEPRSDELVPVIGPIFRGGEFMDGMLKTEVRVDGRDATDKIIRLLNSTRHKPQLRVVMFDGVTFAGFNVLDIKRVHEETGLPVIVINRKKPNLRDVRKALTKFEDFEERWNAILRAGKIKVCRVRGKSIYYQVVGMRDDEAIEVIKLSCTRSFVPEPLRAAHLIAKAIVTGESGGRA